MQTIDQINQIKDSVINCHPSRIEEIKTQEYIKTLALAIDELSLRVSRLELILK